MDIQANKLELIEWLASIQDAKLVSKLRLIQQSFQSMSSITDQEKRAIDQGLISIDQDNIHSHESVNVSTKEKFPQLFK